MVQISVGLDVFARGKEMNKIVLSAITLGVVASASAQSIFGGSNVIMNAGLDMGAPSAGGGVISVPDWVGEAGVGTYGVSNWWEIPDGAWTSGTQFFHGGSNGSTQLTQTKVLDATDLAVVDAGNAAYNLSGWFGGWQTQNDTAALTMRMLDGGAAELGTVRIGDVTATDRASVSSMLQRSASGTLLAGTRSLEFVLVATRAGGTSNDGVADTLSFTAEAVPEPATLLIVASAAALAARKRRQK
jgi:hypothetical protein